MNKKRKTQRETTKSEAGKSSCEGKSHEEEEEKFYLIFLKRKTFTASRINFKRK